MSDKTEKPTQKRVDKSRKEGNFPVSREFIGASQFLVFVWLISIYGPEWFRKSSVNFRTALTAGFRPELTVNALMQVFWSLASGNLFPLLYAGLVLTLTIFIAQMAMTKLGFSLSK